MFLWQAAINEVLKDTSLSSFLNRLLSFVGVFGYVWMTQVSVKKLNLVKPLAVPHLLFCWFLLCLFHFFLKVGRNAVVDVECDRDSVKSRNTVSWSVTPRCPHILADLLFSRNTSCEFSLCAIHLQLPSSRHLRKTFVFLDLLLFFDFIRQEVAKSFVTWTKRLWFHHETWCSLFKGFILTIKMTIEADSNILHNTRVLVRLLKMKHLLCGCPKTSRLTLWTVLHVSRVLNDQRLLAGSEPFSVTNHSLRWKTPKMLISVYNDR